MGRRRPLFWRRISSLAMRKRRIAQASRKRMERVAQLIGLGLLLLVLLNVSGILTVSR
jgi:hypothetical protein